MIRTLSRMTLLSVIVAICLCAGCATGQSSHNLLADPKTRNKIPFFHNKFMVEEDIPLPDVSQRRDGFTYDSAFWISYWSMKDSRCRDWNPLVLKRGTILEFTDLWKDDDRVFCVFFLWTVQTEYSAEVREVNCPEHRYTIYQRRLDDFKKLPWIPVDEKLPAALGGTIDSGGD